MWYTSQDFVVVHELLQRFNAGGDNYTCIG